MVPALVRLLAGMRAFVNGECASLYEALPTVGEIAVVRSLISVDSVVPCQIRFAIKSLLQHNGGLAEVGCRSRTGGVRQRET